MVDGRRELAHARDLCRLIRTTGSDQPVLLIVTEGGLAVVAADWGIDDVLLETRRPGRDRGPHPGRHRQAGRPPQRRPDPEAHIIRCGEVVVDEATYTAKLGGRVLDLTFKEFELLKYLAQHPGRVFTRDQLLQEVWGYDYFGGTRTVDVHVRRLRAKLGTDNEALIGTVRNVGYRFVLPPKEPREATRPRRETPRPRARDTLSPCPKKVSRHGARPARSTRTTSTGRPRTAPPPRYAASPRPPTAEDGASTLNEQAILQLKNRGLAGGVLWLGDGGFALRHGDIARPRRPPRGPRAGASARPSPRAALAGRPARSRPGRTPTTRAPAGSRPGSGIARERELWMMRALARRRPPHGHADARGLPDPRLPSRATRRRSCRSTRSRSRTTPSRAT